MDVIGINLGHDGCIAGISDGGLGFSCEAEKDGNPRHAQLGAGAVMAALPRIGRLPDALGFSGWHDTPGGYYGIAPPARTTTQLLGRTVPVFHTSHERAHILASFALSPLQEGEECHVLTWEGTIGKFYHVDGQFNIRDLGTALSHPGWRYSYLYYLGNPACRNEPGFWERPEFAGKLMALAGIPKPVPLTPAEERLVDYLLSPAPHFTEGDAILRILNGDKRHSPLLAPLADGGVERSAFRNFAHHFSNALFECFERHARRHLKPGLPLLIGGGCGLNCSWNSRWRSGSFFKSVFVPPCTNDSGVAIGAAVDAQLALSGVTKLRWKVDAGLDVVDDVPSAAGWTRAPLDVAAIARRLQQREIIVWMSGRYEMGPRALGNRSLLAGAFDPEAKRRLNHIKQRESYRPVAPVCIAADVEEHFAGGVADPYMLFVSQARHDEIPAVVHDDGTARVQVLTPAANPRLHELLLAFKGLMGHAVLCNTSLNFKGRGCINRLSDAIRLAEAANIRTVVMDEVCLTRG